MTHRPTKLCQSLSSSFGNTSD